VLGRRLRSETPRYTYGAVAPNEFEIVGIVNNERVRGLERTVQPAFYLSTRQFPQTSFSVLVRTTADPRSVAGEVRAAIRTTDAATTFDRPTSLQALLAVQLGPRRMTTEVIGGFAIAALALAALGMYGLLAVLVVSRTREIGIRLALGASPAVVAKQVVTDSLRHAVAGIVIGCVLAMASGRLIQSLLVNVSSRDPATLVVVAGVLLLIAGCAAGIPARRAARVDPVEALRAE
jgi:hypothetical protein